MIASSDANGSSSSSTGLPASSVRRKATRWRIPPDSDPGGEPAKPASPNRSNSGMAAARASARGRPAFSSAMPALSSALRHGSSRSRWGISAHRASRSSGSSSPPTATCPAAGASSPATIESRVDLPQPLGPTTATRAPAGTSRSTPARVSVSP